MNIHKRCHYSVHIHSCFQNVASTCNFYLKCTYGLKTLALRSTKTGLSKQNQLMSHASLFAKCFRCFLKTSSSLCKAACAKSLSKASSQIKIQMCLLYDFIVLLLLIFVIWQTISEMRAPHNQFNRNYTFLPIRFPAYSCSGVCVNILYAHPTA